MQLSTLLSALALMAASSATPLLEPKARFPITPIDTGYYYTLRNDYTGPKVLGISTPLLQLGMQLHSYPIVDSEQFHFVLLTSPPSLPKYAIRNKKLGGTYSFDVWNDDGVNSTEVRMRETGNYSGQFWSVEKWVREDGWRLVNDFTGEGKHLDVYSDTEQAFLGTDDHSGQHWYFDVVGKI